MSNIKVRRTFLAAASLVAVGIAMAVAVMGLPFGRVDERAFAHVYTNGGTDIPTVITGFENVHLHLDADTANGTGPCFPVDTSVTRTIGDNHDVAWCIEGVTGGYEVDAFDFGGPTATGGVTYETTAGVPDKNTADQFDCPGPGGPDPDVSSPCNDDNPDANAVNTTGLGAGWFCDAVGTVDPDSGSLDGRAKLQCSAAIVSPDTDLSNGLLATLNMDVIGLGVDSMAWAAGSQVSLNAGMGPTLLTCYVNIACFGADIDKVGDIEAVKTVVTAPVVAGGPVVFNIAVTTDPDGAFTLVDDLSDPAGGPLFTYDDAATDADGINVGNGVTCSQTVAAANAGAEPNGTNTVTCIGGSGDISVRIHADVAAADQGRVTSNCATATRNDMGDTDLSCTPVTIAGAGVTVDPKDCNPDPINVGGVLTCVVTITVGGPSPTTNMVNVDVADANQTVPVATTCLPGGVAAANTCTWAGPNAPGVYTATYTTTILTSPPNNTCTDVATTTYDGPGDPHVSNGSVTCLPPNVRMQKDADTDFDGEEDIVGAANLFLCTGGPAVCWDPADPQNQNGFGHLVALERLFNQNDPDGAGAFEFQIKFDHKIFDIEVFHGIDLNGDGDCSDVSLGEIQKSQTDGGLGEDCYLYSTGRIPGALGIGGCSMTIVTENWILFGCVSKDPDVPPGDEDVGPIGPDDVIATLHIEPEIDLIQRLTPGQKNGIVSTILDENCEVADIYGDPLATAAGDPLPGIVTGGLVEECTDLIVTVRILEADLDVDCDVDVTDDQAIAFRYGAFFGTLFYDRWFDLEPWTGDFDIDIKDLQKVFGRNGSTCDDPVPPQDPSPTDPPPLPGLP